ncbi:SGNH/GDSL hydrolase family protein [Chitinophaga deserti]|uniref:SGNH/GDSL hydrolase family protein n=1 Tax=Chitinophaga deserti TaxID=2164099 RepID=UPI000D6D0A63|nr:SGNH/GDSL hydrolase family protein [Chitinophaga deserti]
MKLISLLSLLLLTTAVSAQSLRLEQDTVRVNNAELVIRNSTSQVPGYLFNAGNGKTQFRKLGKSIEFRAGEAGYPAAGDSVYQSASLANYYVRVMRNGLLQYRHATQGIGFVESEGKIIFRPALTANDHIHIEAIAGMDLTIEGGEGLPGETPTGGGNPLRLLAGAAHNVNNTFTLRWTVNAQSLHVSPKIVGIGSSTLAGYGLNAPNRFGDLIAAWLGVHTYAAAWSNFAVSGSTSQNMMRVAEGGIEGRNIETALDMNPDFIFLSLASNDASFDVTVAQSMANYRRLDELAKARGIPMFIETTQPRTQLSATQQQLLKNLADSIRKAWPDRYVEGFTPFAGPGGTAVILPQYDLGDGVHLNAAGIKILAGNLFERWLDYFTSIRGVKRYHIDSSLNGTAWAPFYIEEDNNIVKRTFPRYNANPQYYRVRAELKDGSFTPYATPAVLAAAPTYNGPDTSKFTHRLLIDLGGDGLTTLNGNGVKDGKPMPTPDSLGKYWNNWFGIGGVAGFADSSYLNNLVTTKNAITTMSVKLIGLPQGTFGASLTKSINYNGFTKGMGEYPWQALYDNVFFHNSINPNGVVIRVKGLNSASKYHIKLWGARLDPNSSGARSLEVKLGHENWTTAQSFNAWYPNNNAEPDEAKAIWLSGITGMDSVDIVLRVAAGSTFGHLSFLDIGVEGSVPLKPSIIMRDTTTTLSTMQLTATAINGAVINTYTWSQVSGPSTATISNSGSAVANISGLSVGYYVFRASGVHAGETLSKDVTVTVRPQDIGRKVMRAYFSKTAAAPIPGWFNVPGNPHQVSVVMTDPATNWTIDNVAGNTSFWTPFSGNSAFDADGTSTGNNSGVIPDIALAGAWYVYYRNYVPGEDNLLLKGLNPAKTYTLRLYASRNSVTVGGEKRYGCWRINGGSELLQNAIDNTATGTSVTGVSPNAQGTIRISLNVPSSTNTYGNFSLLNAIIVEEE